MQSLVVKGHVCQIDCLSLMIVPPVPSDPEMRLLEMAAIAEKISAIRKRGEGGESSRNEKGRVAEAVESDCAQDAADEKAGDNEKTKPQSP
jgi:hypothetical protein